jgi:DNA-binding XRE family transcriptional regulator
MPPERSKQLVDELRQWYETHSTRQKDLAAALELSPQALNEILAGRNRPNGETVLRIVEFLETNNMIQVFTPKPDRPASVNHPDQPRTLHEARERIAELNAQLQSRPPASGAPSPSQRPGPAKRLDSSASPVYPTDSLKTPGAVQPNKNEMKVSVPLPEKKLLPVSANTPFLITEILKITSLEDLVSMLSNPAHSPLQQSLIYQAVKERRNLVANRFGS